MCLLWFHKWEKRWRYMCELFSYDTSMSKRPWKVEKLYKKTCRECGIEKFKRVRM